MEHLYQCICNRHNYSSYNLWGLHNSNFEEMMLADQTEDLAKDLSEDKWEGLSESLYDGL